MNKKMKRGVFDSSSHEDARARFKHQTLLQDYMELQQETEAARNNLMALKQKELTLQAQVRFLRQRYKFLLKNKQSSMQDQVLVKSNPTQLKKIKKEKVGFGKQKTLRDFDTKKPPRNIPTPGSDSNHVVPLHGVKEQEVQRVVANQRVRINGPKGSPLLDLSGKDGGFRGQEPVVQPRKPVIDLNEISREEEELQERCEPFDPPNQGLIQNDLDEQHTDVRLSIYRNVGSGSGSTVRGGKRKISWQDPVALRV